MSHPSNDPAARARAGDEEGRYRAAAELDPAADGDRGVLLSLLADPSWRVRTAAVERLAAARDPGAVLPGLLASLSGGPTIGARDAAAAALTRIGAAAVEPLLAALSATDPDLRLASVVVLGDVGDRRAAAPLAARLADVDPNVRAAAAEALGKIGGPDAAATLLAALDSDDPTLQLAAIEALAALRVCPDVGRLEPLLADRVLRRPAYRALGASDDPRALALLASGLSEPARGAREAALAGIGMQRAHRPAAELAPMEAVAREAAARDGGIAEGCATALRAEEPFVAVGALTVLAWIAEPRHVAPMLRLGEDDRLRPLVEDALRALPPERELKAVLADAIPEQGPFGRIVALAALARMGSPAALESVIREASDADSHVQHEAIAALGRLGEPRAVAPLAGLLGDDAPGVSSRAANALVEIAGVSPAARAAALQALRDRAGASPSGALFRALGALGGLEDLRRLREGLRSTSVAQRVAAATALGALADRGGGACQVPELVDAVSDPAWSVRAAAARAFADLARAPGADGPLRDDAVAALRAALGDAEPAVRAAAAEALGASGRVEVAGALAALASGDAPAQVAVAALHALAALGPPPVEVVAAAAAHADPEVVKEAVAVAARLPGPEAARIVRDAAASARWDVRRAAARAMLVRQDATLLDEAERRAADEPDPLVARAFADAAAGLGGAGPRR